MKCSCGKVALYHVSGKGYCGDHRAQAYAAASEQHNRAVSQLAAECYRIDSGRQAMDTETLRKKNAR